MSDPLWRNTRIRVNGNEELVATAKQIIRLLSGKAGVNQGENYVEKLLVDGIEVSVDDMLSRPSFDTVEFAFEYYSSDTIQLYEQLLKKVSQRGSGYGAIEYCCAHFTNSMHPFGDVRSTDVDLSSNDDEWCTEIDQAITITLGIDELCGIMGRNPSGLFATLQDEGAIPLEELLDEGLVETIFGGDEAELMSYELGSNVGSHFIEFAPGSYVPITHCSLDTSEQKWNELLIKLNGPLGASGDVILVEPPEDLDPDKVRLEFQPNDEMFRGAPLLDYMEYRAAYEEAVSSLEERDGTIELRWEDELEDNVGVASFAAANGFKMLSFETGPNHWGEFKAVEYEL